MTLSLTSKYDEVCEFLQSLKSLITCAFLQMIVPSPKILLSLATTQKVSREYNKEKRDEMCILGCVLSLRSLDTVIVVAWEGILLIDKGQPFKRWV